MRPQRFRLGLHAFIYYSGMGAFRHSGDLYRKTAYDIYLRWWHPLCLPLVAILAASGFYRGVRMYVMPELLSEIRMCFGGWMGPNTIPQPPPRTESEDEP